MQVLFMFAFSYSNGEPQLWQSKYFYLPKLQSVFGDCDIPTEWAILLIGFANPEQEALSLLRNVISETLGTAVYINLPIFASSSETLVKMALHANDGKDQALENPGLVRKSFHVPRADHGNGSGQ